MTDATREQAVGLALLEVLEDLIGVTPRVDPECGYWRRANFGQTKKAEWKNKSYC